MAEEISPGSLAHTPTWAVATVCFIIISISVFLEHSINLIMDSLKKRRKTVLYNAIGRVKSDFMLLGFLSFLLAATEKSIPKICISAELENTMLPCGSTGGLTAHHDRWNNRNDIGESVGGEAASHHGEDDACKAKGKVSLITSEGVEQLGQFLFVLAATQSLYSVLTVALGRFKMRRWKKWEKETQSKDNKNNQNKRRFSRQTTFSKRHEACTETTLQLWVKCFFRQFFSSVEKTDYLTLRHGFITTHLSSGQLSSFNFQKYITHSLDEDFRTVIGISPLMWFIVVIFMLVDIHGWHSYFWISFIPLTMVLTVGTKLEVIVAKMALDLKNKKNVIVGSPQVELRDDNFWFGQPNLLLDLLHLTLFLNAFEVAFFIWVMMEFGSDSCYHERNMTLVRLVLALVVQVICSYVTLPHYALVTQMRSQFKGNIFNEKVAQVLKQWHTQVRRARRKKQECSSSHADQPAPNRLIENHDDNSLGQSPAEGGHEKSKIFTDQPAPESLIENHDNNSLGQSPAGGNDKLKICSEITEED